MLLNYLKLALRLLLRNPFFTFINVLGIAVGFLVFFLLWRYAQSELHSDQFHKAGARVTALVMHVNSPGIGEADWIFIPAQCGQVMKESIPEIEEYTRVIFPYSFEEIGIPDHGKNLFFSYTSEKMERNAFREDKVFYADENFFRFFTFPFVYGSPDHSLNEPNSIVLSKSTALRYFGEEQPLGKILFLNDSVPMTVTGVCSDVPKNSAFNFDVVFSTNRISRLINHLDPLIPATATALRFREGVNTKALEPQFDSIFHERFNAVMSKYFPELTYRAWFLPLHEWKFWGGGEAASKFYLNLLRVASMLVLVMAWINYVNLTVSLAGRRTTELLARQVVGARPRDFIQQFLVESMTINLIALLLSITLLQFVKQPAEIIFGFYSPGMASFSAPSYVVIVIVLLGGVIITGSYLAWITSRRSAGNLIGLKQTWKNKTDISVAFRIIPYAAAMSLMVWTFSVYDQVRYVLHKDLGLSTSEAVVIDLPDFNQNLPQQSLQSFVKALSSLNSVVGQTVSHGVPGDGWSIETIKRSDESTVIQVNSFGGVDERFIPFYGLPILYGRNFIEGMPANMSSIIISENASKRLGFESPEDAVGQKIRIESKAYNLDKMIPVEVIGIIKDYTPYPLFGADENNNELGSALTFSNLVQWHLPHKISLRIKMASFEETIEQLRHLYTDHFGGQVFNWYFVDENIQRHYVNQKTTRNQILFFSCLAISIASLGLLGMISNRAVEKTKEIGIRKVLGAELQQIAHILLSTTLKQVTVAIAVGVPVAWYLTQQYLQKFSDRIQLQWWHFIIPVIILIVIMLGTVATVVWKAAKSNPVEALKYE